MVKAVSFKYIFMLIVIKESFAKHFENTQFDIRYYKMKNVKQYSHRDLEGMQNRKTTRTQKQLEKIEKLVDWQKKAETFSVINKSGSVQGGRPWKELVMMIKLLYIQYL